MIQRLAFSAVMGFAFGVLVTVWGYDQQEKQKQMQTAEAVKKCAGYRVQAVNGTHECHDLMVRFDYWWGCPQTKKEVRQKAWEHLSELRSNH